MNDREMLLRKLSGAQFALWETHLFLDTHPYDANALTAKKKYEKKYSDYELHQRIFRTLLQKGFSSDDIKKTMEE